MTDEEYYERKKEEAVNAALHYVLTNPKMKGLIFNNGTKTTKKKTEPPANVKRRND